MNNKKVKKNLKKTGKWTKKQLKDLGPGITTGASDVDPSGIATYAQTGAQFGYGQLWTALYLLPFLIVVQEACARISGVTSKGLATIIKDYYSKKILYPIIFLLFIANFINIGADLAAMASVIQMFFSINFLILIVVFTIIILILEIFFNYKHYNTFLKWLALSLIAYPLTIFFISPSWLHILKATIIPHIEFNFDFLYIITGIFGTTISPYLFFWEASQTVEKKREDKILQKNKNSRAIHRFLQKLHWDNFFGMFFAQIANWSIITLTASTLFIKGITDIKTPADAAKALEPLVHTFPQAGFIAKLIFAIGILGLGFLAIPVLAGSAAYTVCVVFNCKSGLNLKLKQAPEFYLIIILAMVLGVIVNFIGINPIKFLIFTAVLNGIVAIPMLLLIILISSNQKIMGSYKSGVLSRSFLILTFLMMSFAPLMLIIHMLI